MRTCREARQRVGVVGSVALVRIRGRILVGVVGSLSLFGCKFVKKLQPFHIGVFLEWVFWVLKAVVGIVAETRPACVVVIVSWWAVWRSRLAGFADSAAEKVTVFGCASRIETAVVKGCQEGASGEELPSPWSRRAVSWTLALGVIVSALDVRPYDIILLPSNVTHRFSAHAGRGDELLTVLASCGMINPLLPPSIPGAASMQAASACTSLRFLQVVRD